MFWTEHVSSLILALIHFLCHELHSANLQLSPQTQNKSRQMMGPKVLYNTLNVSFIPMHCFCLYLCTAWRVCHVIFHNLQPLHSLGSSTLFSWVTGLFSVVFHDCLTFFFCQWRSVFFGFCTESSSRYRLVPSLDLKKYNIILLLRLHVASTHCAHFATPHRDWEAITEKPGLILIQYNMTSCTRLENPQPSTV